MGSSPSTEVKANPDLSPPRRSASVSDFRSSSEPVTRKVSKPLQPNQMQSNTPSTSSSKPDANRSSTSAPRVIRGGRADAIPEVRNADDIVFETFYHESGRNYTCMYTNDTRYYLDSFQSGDWKEFPMEWYQKGTLDVDDVLGSQESPEAAQAQSTGSQSQNVSVDVGDSKKDGREGVIKIPGKGVFQTYIFEHRRNVHCYFDPDEGAWIKLPLRWELKTDVAKKLVRQVQELSPQWRDECDLLASLRASNYNVEDCINTYHATQGTYGAEVASGFDSGLSREKSIIQQNDSYDSVAAKLNAAEKKLDKKNMRLDELEKENGYLNGKISELEELLASTKAECSATIAKVESLQRERPVSSRPKTPAVQIVEKETVSKQDLQELHKNVKQMHKCYLQLVSDTKSLTEHQSKSLTQVKEAMKKLGSSSKATDEQVEEVRALYRREVLQRKLLYNQLQELRGNIRVFCRMRNDKSSAACITAANDQEVVTNGKDKKVFQFDRTFGYDSTQEQVYEVVSPIVTSCADGYNVSIMAYGQTGSGKTFTMLGPNMSNPGVNVRAIKELFKICNDRKDTTEFSMHLSMVEIYNECIQDLLRKDVRQVELRSTGTKVTLVDITEMPIVKEKDILDALDKGTSNRKVASTKMNSQSSRSHLVLILSVIGRDLVSGTRSKGTLTLCDLAGSERVGKTGASGEQLAEAAFINKSLTSLGQVFAALRDNQLHIPYRNSKLTHLLMPSLGGDAKACLFVNVSPLDDNRQETLSTLLFGVNARQVTLGQAKKNVIK